MPKLNVDFSDVKDFEALPKGEYECVISEVKVVEPSEDGKYPYVQLTMKVSEEGDYKDRMLWARWSQSPKALFRMKNDLENLGFPVDEIEFDYDEDSGFVTEPELVGMPVIASVSQREYQGNTQNDIDVLRSIDGAKVGAKKKTTAAAGRGKRTFK